MEFSQSTKNNIICDSVILYTGIFANLGVLIHLHKTWISRNRVQFYILALCVADCLGLILRQCVEVGLHTTESWNTGEIGCKIIMSISMAGTFLAHLVLVTFNIDNLVAVTHRQSPSQIRLCQLTCAALMTGLFIGGQVHVFIMNINWDRKSKETDKREACLWHVILYVLIEIMKLFGNLFNISYTNITYNVLYW